MKVIVSDPISIDGLKILEDHDIEIIKCLSFFLLDLGLL